MSDDKLTPYRLRELLAPYEFDAQGCGGRKVLKLSLEEAEELIGVDYSSSSFARCSCSTSATSTRPSPTKRNGCTRQSWATRSRRSTTTSRAM